MLAPAAVLADDPSLDITIIPPSEALPEGDITAMLEADVVVFQRPMQRWFAEAIPILQQGGTAVVVEVDDDFHSLPAGHPSRRFFAPMNNPDRNWRWLKHHCQIADLVTVSTPALAERYGAHGRIAVLPNCVPEAYLSIEAKPNDRMTIGWSGTPVTHLGDLEVTGSAVRDVMAETGAAFRAIGSAHTLDVLGVEGEVVDWLPLTDYGPDGYLAAVASLDIGIVPLCDNTFNRSKSNIKGLEMAALGVPFVASPAPEYATPRRRAGVLAHNESEWWSCLYRLINDRSYRKGIIDRGRQVARYRTYEKQAYRWAEAWAAALLIRRGEKAA